MDESEVQICIADQYEATVDDSLVNRTPPIRLPIGLYGSGTARRVRCKDGMDSSRTR
jgi:hypothetical protein